MNKNIPVFEKRIFQDVNFEALDYDKKMSFIIERVFERGDVQDIRNCRRYYGDDLIMEVLLSAKYIPLQRLYLASAVLGVPLKSFRCYTSKQLKETHCPY